MKAKTEKAIKFKLYSLGHLFGLALFLAGLMSGILSLSAKVIIATTNFVFSRNFTIDLTWFQAIFAFIVGIIFAFIGNRIMDSVDKHKKEFK